MDKAALDLYAIFQQTQDENASNYVDENATDSSLEEDEEKENITEVNDNFVDNPLLKIDVIANLNISSSELKVS